MRVLVIEDEPRMLELLRRGLQERNCAVMTAIDGETALEITASCTFDAILLDIGLPRRDGYEVIRLLRERACLTRVLMLTARDSEDDIIRGLNLGADDLVARLQSITRSRPAEANGKIEAGELIVDPARRSVIRANRQIDLSRSEFSLLVSLIRSAGQCVPRRSLVEGVWGADAHIGAGALDVLINALRAKIDAPFPRKLIHTVRRSGYMLTSEAGEMELTRP